MFFSHLDTLGFQWGRALSVTAYFFKNQFREDMFVLFYGLMGYSPSQQGRFGGRSFGWLLTLYLRSGSRVMTVSAQLAISFVYSLRGYTAHGMVSSSFRVDLPILITLIETIPNRHEQRRVSWMILVSIKLTTLRVPIYRK